MRRRPPRSRDYVALRTTALVNDRARLGTRVVSKIPFRQVQRTEEIAPGVDIFAGGWFDDGDGVPEPGDDLIGCDGGGFHQLGMKPVPVAPRSAYRDARVRLSE